MDPPHLLPPSSSWPQSPVSSSWIGDLLPDPPPPPNRCRHPSPITPHSDNHLHPPSLPKRPKLSPASEIASKTQLAACNAQASAARSKERLGERITALQQLVSPFGKTDTASVLSEAIGYIKFLQEQVQVLSSPYMKPSINRQDTGNVRSASKVSGEAESDLRSRGLCLVPVSCTLNVAANNNGADFWASSIGGGARY